MSPPLPLPPLIHYFSALLRCRVAACCCLYATRLRQRIRCRRRQPSRFSAEGKAAAARSLRTSPGRNAWQGFATVTRTALYCRRGNIQIPPCRRITFHCWPPIDVTRTLALPLCCGARAIGRAARSARVPLWQAAMLWRLLTGAAVAEIARRYGSRQERRLLRRATSWECCSAHDIFDIIVILLSHYFITPSSDASIYFLHTCPSLFRLFFLFFLYYYLPLLSYDDIFMLIDY